jgi:hypothetical protein
MTRFLWWKTVGMVERRRERRVRPRLEVLEDRCTPVVLTGTPTPPLTPNQPTEGSPFTGQFGVAFDDDSTVTPTDFKVSINWGDGTPIDNSTGVVTALGANQFGISGTHTYNEEAGSVVPPSAFPVALTVTDTRNNLTTTIDSSAFVADANLSQGNPVTATGQVFSGTGSGTATSLASFESAIGGSKNTTAAPQSGGFRTITWDGVKTNGTDMAAGPNSTTVITPNTVGIPLDRFQGSGVYFGAVYAVSGADANGNTFTQTNPSVAGLFPPFSSPNTFAMFNDNGIDFKFVAPSATNTDITNASSRGFGAVFVNVELPNTTSVQYFNGNTLLATVFAPVGGPGQPVFVGDLFPSAIVTRVVLTLGTDAIFKFDGTTVTPGATDDGVNTNLVVTDDWAFAEPVATPNGLPIVTGAAGTALAKPTITATTRQPFTGVVGSFSDLDPMANARDFTATINWGDGHLTNATIQANTAGGFDVSGSNTYLKSGTFPINVDVMDFGGGPGFAGSVPVVSINNTAVVTNPPQTVGGFDSTTGTWFLDPVNNASFPSPAPFQFGVPGFKPVIGDWNNDGTQTIGVFDPGVFFGDPDAGMWFIRNSNSAGAPDASFSFGVAGGIPVSGDWLGKGQTGIGIYDPFTSTFFLRSTPSAGPADVGIFQFGMPGGIPVVGDWTGTGHTGIGVFDPTTATFFLRNEPNAGQPDAGTFAYGIPGLLPLTGDWTGSGKTGIGVFVPATATFFLRSEANAGFADAGIFSFGTPTFRPVAGNYTLHLLAAGGSGPGGVPLLDNSTLQNTVAQALSQLRQAGVSSSVVSSLAADQYTIGSLPVGELGIALPDAHTAVFSPDAAGYGWSGAAAGPPANQMDLLTAVLHEMGHLSGLPDGSQGVMNDALPTGTRRDDGLGQVF